MLTLGTSAVAGCHRRVHLSLLKKYGGEVCLARQEDHTVPEAERILAVENHNAGVYIIIGAENSYKSPYSA